ncbi:MAG: hypothetical protein HY436_00010 [Candidatus Liptonbacteria bacterium]|nr:hypothetical protein [Candidatus Liptonbacteria bacterium]
MTSGQAMLLTILALGGTILAATTVAGLFTLYELRQAADLAASTRAIAAADAGLEWGLYNFYCFTDPDGLKTPCPLALPTFTNGASVAVVCEDAAGGEFACDDATLIAEAKAIRSVGNWGNAHRAFRLDF